MADANDKIRAAFQRGRLTTRSVSPEGEVCWKPILAVFRHEVPKENFVAIETDIGGDVFTGGHRVFITPTHKKDAETFTAGEIPIGIKDGSLSTSHIKNVRPAAPRQYMFDITVADWHNFQLVRSGLVVSNSPDRNYRFMPPKSEGEVGCYNQVFGYIWEDAEFAEYLEIALWKWNAHPPETEELSNLDILCQQKPAWKASILWGALVNAAQALAYNWTANEFDYSIGGISLNLEKSSKYMDLKRNAEEQWDKLTEAKARTTKYMRGLAQPRFGRGVRSAFGPYVGKGVLSPRNFVVVFITLLGHDILQGVFHAHILPPL